MVSPSRLNPLRMKTESILRPTVVEVTAPWCGECRAMKPTIEAVADRHPNVDFKVIDASTDAETVKALGVKGTPTLIGYTDGEEIFRSTGRRTRTQLEAMFKSVTGAEPVPAVGKSDLYLRVGTGVALIALGLLSGPAWPLVGIGAIVGLFGFLPMRKHRP